MKSREQEAAMLKTSDDLSLNNYFNTLNCKEYMEEIT